MATFTVHEAQDRLEELIERARIREDTIIRRDDHLSVRLVPRHPPRRQFGAIQGQIDVPETETFFEPLPDDELVD